MASGVLGNRRFYKKLSAGISLYATASVYLPFVLFQYFWSHDDAALDPIVLAAAGGFAFGFTLYAYVCMLLLDAQILAPEQKEQNETDRFTPLP